MSETRPMTEHRRRQMREARRRWVAAHPERERQVQREAKARARAEDPEKHQQYMAAYTEANREAIRQRNSQYQADIRSAVFGHYGSACACCGSTDRLTIDHVNGGGRDHRAEIGGGGIVLCRWLLKNDFPDGFQTLCMPCNSSKSDRPACRLNHASVTA